MIYFPLHFYVFNIWERSAVLIPRQLYNNDNTHPACTATRDLQTGARNNSNQLGSARAKRYQPLSLVTLSHSGIWSSLLVHAYGLPLNTVLQPCINNTPIPNSVALALMGGATN